MRAYLPVAILVAGCTAQPPAERLREQALQAAYEIGQVQMACPDATPTITSTQLVEPTAGGAPGASGREFIYTANVAGCGDTREYVINCHEGDGVCSPSAR